MKNTDAKIIFAGTSEFGIPTLEKLLTLNYQLLTVITNPDRPAGREKTLTPPPIKIWAEKNNIPVLQPVKILDSKFQILNSNPDLLLVAAYGQIIPEEILNLPRLGSLNIHASLLPKYRGASPIQAAILNNESETGITLIQMDEKMDHGPIIAAEKTNISPEDDYLSLSNKLSSLAAALVCRTLPDWINGKLTAQKQDHAQASFCKLLTRTDARIDWTKNAEQIWRMTKAFSPQPGCWTTLNSKSVKILKASPIPDFSQELPGTFFNRNKQLLIKCGRNALRVDTLQLEGKKPVSGLDFLNTSPNIKQKLFI